MTIYERILKSNFFIFLIMGILACDDATSPVSEEESVGIQPILNKKSPLKNCIDHPKLDICQKAVLPDSDENNVKNNKARYQVVSATLQSKVTS